MLRFKTFLLEKGMAGFKPLAKAAWFQYKDDRDRIKILLKAIKDGTPVTGVDGKDIELANTNDNKRSVQDFIDKEDDPKVKTFNLVDKKGTVIQSNKIGKSPLFGGQGVGGGATARTEEAESLQCVFCAAVVGEGLRKEFGHFTPELLESYYNSNKVSVRLDFGELVNLDPSWFQSGYMSARKLLEDGYINKKHTFHCSDTKMKAVYDAKVAALRSQGMPAVQNDKWNPGDIWAIESNFNPKASLEKGDIYELNKQIKELFDSRTMVGISLKKIGSLKKKVNSEVKNLDKVELDEVTFKQAYARSYKSGRGNFMGTKSCFITWDARGEATLKPSTAMAAVNFEQNLKGARGGKAGWGYIMYACKEFLGVTLKTAASYKIDARSIKNGNDRATKDFYNKAKLIEDVGTYDEFKSEIAGKALDWIHSKLQGVLVCHAFKSQRMKSKKDEAASYLVNHSGSKIDISSVYVKISE
tara:strand:+ start:198 stop:1610 length:1413 start_codon:yes stop_codon:yes gene_type:complete